MARRRAEANLIFVKITEGVNFKKFWFLTARRTLHQKGALPRIRKFDFCKNIGKIFEWLITLLLSVGTDPFLSNAFFLLLTHGASRTREERGCAPDLQR